MLFPYTTRISNSENETIALANEFSGFINDGMIIILNGDLGSGKTFFIKQVLKNFDIFNANSPTFAIVNEYTGKKKFYHFDFYRINKFEELIDIGIEDYFKDLGSIVFVEWGNLFPRVLPKNRIEISISVDDENIRTFNFNQI